MLIRIYTIVIIGSLIPIFCSAQTKQDCNELVQFRDNELFEIYSTIQNQSIKNVNLTDLKNDFLNYRKELEDLSNSADFGAFMVAIKTVTDAFYTTTNTLLGKAIKETGKQKEFSIRLYRALDKIYKSPDPLNFNNEELEILYEAASVIPIVNSLTATLRNVQTLNEYNGSKSEIKNQIKIINTKIEDLEVKISELSSPRDFLFINDLKINLDEYLNGACTN